MVVLVPLNESTVDKSIELAKSIKDRLTTHDINATIKPPINIDKMDGFVVLISETFDTHISALQLNNESSLDECILKITSSWSIYVHNNSFQPTIQISPN